MLTRRVIPCLDCRDGRVVKGVRFQGLRDAGDPVELAAAYADQGADEIVLLDVSATPEGRGHQLETVRAVRERLAIPLTVGGGVRGVDDVRRLLEAGADKVSVNTAAVDNPRLLADVAERFGRQCTVLALDAARVVCGGAVTGEAGTEARPTEAGTEARPTEAGTEARPTGAAAGVRDVGWQVVVRSGRERLGLDAIAWARAAVALGAGEILLTSWDRDGTRSGYDLDLLLAITTAVNVPVIASGGAASPDHMCQAIAHGADAVLAASIFHDGEFTVSQLKARLAAAGVEVRR